MISLNDKVVRTTYNLNHISVTMGGCEVKRSVVPHVGGVNPRTPGYQHLHYLQVAALGGPVQGGELVVVTEIINI